MAIQGDRWETFPPMSLLLNLPTIYYSCSPVSDEGEQGQKLIEYRKAGPSSRTGTLQDMRQPTVVMKNECPHPGCPNSSR